MFDDRRSGRHDAVMLGHGDTTARGLCDRCAGHPQTGTGWRAALQRAADHSDQDPEILNVADEIYAMAHLMRTSSAVLAYAEASRTVVRSHPADVFLRGMLDHVRRRTHGAPG